MKHIHEKSRCCDAPAVHFGNRRRQCTRCKRTWRVWRRRRGRKGRRRTSAYALRYLGHAAPPPFVTAAYRARPRTTLQRRLTESRAHFIAATPWPSAPPGPLIAIADAWMRYLEGSWHCWYLILLRSTTGTEAMVTPLTHGHGRESVAGWRTAFDALPHTVRDRIRALVCDGHRGLVYEARWRGWKLQRCHFHLLAAVQGRRSRWGAGRHRTEGQRLYELVRRLLTVPTGTSLTVTVNELEDLGWTTHSAQLTRIVQGFLNHLGDYRTYLTCPDLHLPRTSNAAEVFFSFVEELCRRAHGFTTAAALSQWITAIAKYRKHIRCNGTHQPN